jgi:hypothetical protein
MCVCVYVCMYACMHAHLYVCIYIYIYILMDRCADMCLVSAWTVAKILFIFGIQESSYHRSVPVHEDVWGSRCIDPRILDLDTGWKRVVSFKPRSLYTRGNWITGWLGPRTGLFTVGKRIISRLCRQSEVNSPAVKPAVWSLYRLSYSVPN